MCHRLLASIYFILLICTNNVVFNTRYQRQTDYDIPEDYFSVRHSTNVRYDFISIPNRKKNVLSDQLFQVVGLYFFVSAIE